MGPDTAVRVYCVRVGGVATGRAGDVKHGKVPPSTVLPRCGQAGRQTDIVHGRAHTSPHTCARSQADG